MALRRAIGAVKDQTSIGLAKVGSNNSLADLDVAIVKATRHEEYPAEEKYFREILSLTCYSRAYVGACVNTLSRRLSKTKNWVVALKTLMLIQRLLTEGDPAYEQEIFFTTRRGTRLLNMSDFRDTSRSNSWDYSAFVRTYALYLDERLEFRMHGQRKKNSACSYSYEEEEELPEENASASNASASNASASNASTSYAYAKTTPIRELKIEQLLPKMYHLQQLLERFLATKPTGVAKYNRIIMVALHSAIKESGHIYNEITDLLGILIDKFMELEIPECVKVYDIFCRISKQFDELDAYYTWCKEVGIIRASEYPEVERITPKKLELMDEFIRDKAANAQNKLAILAKEQAERVQTPLEEENKDNSEDMNTIKSLPPPEGFPKEEVEQETEEDRKEKEPESTEADLLNLGDDAPALEEHGDQLALALFDGETGAPGIAPPPIWEAFNETSDWETTLVQTASYLPHQKASLGGGFDTMLLNGMYQQGEINAAVTANRIGGSGSASSVALGSVGNPQLLALPAPPTSSSCKTTSSGKTDPFEASLGVAPPPYVQMSEIEKKQKLLVEEQLMWQQYHKDGMQGHIALSNMQSRAPNTGGYGYRYGY